MGLRSWLTPVYNQTDFDQVVSVAQNGALCNGISYILQVTKQGTPFKAGGVVIAWSGDGSQTVNELKSTLLIHETYLLDNFLVTFPVWHEGEGPQRFGFFLKDEARPDWSLINDKTDYIGIQKLMDFSRKIWDKYAGYIGSSSGGFPDNYDGPVSDSYEFYFTFEDINKDEFIVYIDKNMMVRVFKSMTDEDNFEYRQFVATIKFDDLVNYLDNLPLTASLFFNKRRIDVGDE